ncbi:MAG: dipicolinate synthase subunit B [Oscillospiraceae bacterium]|jgi:dipicolinate synthase subunit B|nr:dipicolinate synthase subunit B [Oscillospiraceae bacterium]
MNKICVGFAICGSFCTIPENIKQMKYLIEKNYEVIPIMSKNAYSTDTRFGKAKDIVSNIENICNKKIITKLTEAEPIGPKKMTDIMIISPCTGNTLSKLSMAITDGVVTLAAKSHLRRKKPLLISLATNDALGASAQNIGKMLNLKNIYFVPFSQDDPKNKPNSLVAHFDLILPSLKLAILGEQIQPVFQ